MLTQVLELIAVLGVGTLSGAMVYESTIEIGVRKKTKPKEKLANWHLCFPAASGLFKPFGIALLPITLAAGYIADQYIWFMIAAILFSLLPFTQIAIAPTNAKLLAMTTDSPEGEIEQAINCWDNRHHIRTGMTVTAFILSVLTVVFL